MKLIDISLYLVYIAMYSVIIPVGIGINLFNKLTKPLKILFAELCVVLLLNILLLFCDVETINTSYYLFSMVDVLTFAWVFSLALHRKSTYKVFFFVTALIIVFIIIDAFWISGLKNIGFSNGIARLAILFIALYYLAQLFQADFENDLTKEPMFWVSVGVISYNLVGFFDIFSAPIVNYSQSLYLQYYMFWSLVNVFMYIAFGRSFWLCKNNSR